MMDSKAMVVAVASGKGGTGKTTVAAHLALACSRVAATTLVDLDVEAPDALSYFTDAKRAGKEEDITVAVPSLVRDRCTGCGRCAKACRFGAIVAIGGVVSINNNLCKGCGRCIDACPASALVEREVSVGKTSAYSADKLGIIEGRMTVGDIRSTAVIEAAKRRASVRDAEIHIRDCPPGVSCPAAHALEGVDFAVLVAEPTEFSLHDLDAAIRLAKSRGLPTGVVINKDGFGTADVTGFCEARAVPIIGRISFQRSRAETGALARLWNADEAFMDEMRRIIAVIRERLPRGTQA